MRNYQPEGAAQVQGVITTGLQWFPCPYSNSVEIPVISQTSTLSLL